MRALILAAGRGERLRPLTDDRPKCLVSIAGRPALSWQLDALATCGIRTVAMVTGYRAETLRPFPVRRLVNPRWARTNMVASLLCARRWLRAAPCVVAYGDVVYHPAIVAALLRSRDDIAITYDLRWRALWDIRFAQPEADAESLYVHDGRVVDIGSRYPSLDRIDGQFMGFLRLTPRGWARLENVLAALDAAAIERLDTTALLQRSIEAGTAVGAVPVEGRWCELDSLTDLTAYEARLRSPVRWTHDFRPL